MIVEKCCRVMKHGLRCVKAEAFKPMVPSLAKLIVHNATVSCREGGELGNMNIELHSLCNLEGVEEGRLVGGCLRGR